MLVFICTTKNTSTEVIEAFQNTLSTGYAYDIVIIKQICALNSHIAVHE